MTIDDPQKAMFRPGYDTSYQSTVNPERVVVLPGYSLRLLAHGDLTPRELSLWLAFRQGVYATWRDDKPESVKASLPHQWLLPFAMMSRASFFRETTGQDSLCGGLVQVIPDQANPQDTRQVAHSRCYQVSMSPRLTRRDMGILQDILARAAGQGESGLARIEAKLRELLNLNPGAYLDDPCTNSVQVEGWPHSLADVIRRILGLKVQDVPASLTVIADRLQERILAGYGKLVISHYFLQTVVPQLEMTHAQAWTIIALRDRAWFDYATGERWPFTIVHDGLEGVAAMTGSSVKSVRRWLGEPGFCRFVFVNEKDGVILPDFWQESTIVFNVNLLEPISGLDKVSTVPGQNEHRAGTKRALQRDKVSTVTGQNEHTLNRFIKRYLTVINRRHRANDGFDYGQIETLADGDFQNLEESPVFAPPPAAAGGDFSENQVETVGWSLDDLVRQNTVSSKKAREMRRVGVSGQAFASWIAEAFSRQGIDRPIALAVVSAIDHPTGAPGIYAELFARPRPEVLELLAQSIAGYPMTKPVIRKLSIEKRRALYLALGGSESDIPPRYVPPVQPAAQKPARQESPTPVEIPDHVRAQAAEIKARLRAGR